MKVANKQGRPTKASGFSGRERLVSSTRDYLRKRPKLRLTRGEIAEACGVTPALMSYYFKSQESLLEAVAKPLIGSYRQRLLAILAQHTDQPARMRNIIRLLIELNADDAFLLDYLLDHVGLADLDAEVRANTDLFRDAVSTSLTDLMASGIWRSSNPENARLTLWATCRVLGERLRFQMDHPSSDSFDRASALAEYTEFAFGVFADPNTDTRH